MTRSPPGARTRTACITAALDAGTPLRVVQRFSSHAKADLVPRYDDNRRAPAITVARTVAALL